MPKKEYWLIAAALLAGVLCPFSAEGSGDALGESLAATQKIEKEYLLGNQTYSREEYSRLKEDAKNAAAEGRGADCVAVFGGHRYYLFYGGCATWEEARRRCEALGGHLATVESAEENLVLFKYVMNERLALAEEKNRHPFFGLYNEYREWKWVDGTPLTFTNWYKGKSRGDEKKFYARMNLDKTLTTHGLMPVWEAAEFKNSAYLCEWDIENENVPRLPELDMQQALDQVQREWAVAEGLDAIRAVKQKKAMGFR